MVSGMGNAILEPADQQTKARILSRDELAASLPAGERLMVIDVLPEEDYNAGHIPGAKNACVFKVSFVEDVKKLSSDLSRPVVVYGCSSRDLASATAAEKLLAAGYSEVRDYRGGFEEWLGAGNPVERASTPVQTKGAPRDGVHAIDIAKSKIEWIGRNLTGSHSGIIRLKSGKLEVQDGRPVRGTFTVDMHSIENGDIQDAALRQVLIEHLKSDDFFDVQRFPAAEFELLNIQGLPDAKAGNPNYEVEGSLTMKGKTNGIRFPAIIGPTAAGVLAADAHFDIDRTRWNVLYGSGKFYERLGMHLVNDEISLAVKLITLPPG